MFARMPDFEQAVLPPLVEGGKWSLCGLFVTAVTPLGDVLMMLLEQEAWSGGSGIVEAGASNSFDSNMSDFLALELPEPIP